MKVARLFSLKFLLNIKVSCETKWNKKLKDMISVAKGPLKYDVTGVQGEGVPKISDKKWDTRGYMLLVTSPPKNMFNYKFLFYTCFWSVWQRMNLKPKMLTRWKMLRSSLTDHVSFSVWISPSDGHVWNHYEWKYLL